MNTKNEKPVRTVSVYTEEAVKNAAKLPAEVWREIKHYNKVQMTDYLTKLWRAGYNKGYMDGYDDHANDRSEKYSAMTGKAEAPQEAPQEAEKG